MSESMPIASNPPAAALQDGCGQLFIDDNPTDVVHAVLSLVQKAVVEGRNINDATLLEIDGRVRRDYGNGSTYCAGKTPARTLSKLVRADLAREVPGKPIREVEELLAVAFDDFLVELSRWPVQRT